MNRHVTLSLFNDYLSTQFARSQNGTHIAPETISDYVFNKMQPTVGT